MGKKTLGMLLVALAVAAGATVLVWILARPESAPVKMGDRLFADIDVNAVEKIRMDTPGGGRFLVLRKEGGWVVPARNDYPADFNQVVQFVRKMADLEVGRMFMAAPGDLKRLHLAEPQKDTAGGGILVTLLDGQDNELASLILGSERLSKTGQTKGMPGGQFVRRPGSDSVFLVAQYFGQDVANPTHWLDSTVVKIDVEEIESISCMTGSPEFDQEVYTVGRPEKGAPFAPRVFPGGKKLSRIAVNRLAGFLSLVSLEDVAPAQEPPEQFSDVMLAFRLFDGRIFKVWPDRGHPPGACSVRLDVGYEGPQEVEAEPAQKDLDAGEGDKPPQQDRAEEAARMSEKLSPWVYTLASWQCGKLITDPQALAEQEKPAGTAASSPRSQFQEKRRARGSDSAFGQ
ncbi:MAG: DUF4340 domain-containing protein [Deltaproteobacteria bacterium]|nr:DUF4340 domain-containing protein [Deltaproteobacteria bacterium]